MNTQIPLSPETVHPATYRYEPVPDAPKWQIEDWRALTTAFTLSMKDVPSWHHALVGQGRPWEIVRRIYQIAPLFGNEVTPDDEKRWTLAELSQKWTVPEKTLAADHAAIIAFWKETKGNADLQERLNIHAALPDFGTGPQVEDSEIAPLLIRFRFDHIEEPKERKRVANRVLELRAQFDVPAYRETARQIVIMEGLMMSYEKQLVGLQRQLDKMNQNSEDLAGKTAISLDERFRQAQKALTDLTTKHRELLAEIGAETEEADEQRRLAIDTFGYTTEAMIRYYSKGNRDLVDGVHTAGEVLFLLTPTDVRDFQQYRPDVVTRINEALQPQNLWKDGYKPTVVQRDACRLLKKLCDGLTEEPAGSRIEEIDKAANSDEEEDDHVFFDAAMHPEAVAPDLKAQNFSAPATRDDSEFIVASYD